MTKTKPPARWLPYDTAHWNPGNRPIREIVAVAVDAFAGNLSPRPVVAFHWNETGDLIRDQSFVERLARKGIGSVVAPALQDARKVMLSYDPDRLDTGGVEPWCAKVGDAFPGVRSNGKRKTFENKYVLGQEFRDLGTGWTPIHATAHVWPSVQLNSLQVAQMVRETARTLEDTAGTLVFTWDANMAEANGMMAPMRVIGLTSSQARFGPTGTWQNKDGRPIDQGWVRESGHYQLTGQRVVFTPGEEKAGGRHAVLVLEGQMRVRD